MASVAGSPLGPKTVGRCDTVMRSMIRPQAVCLSDGNVPGPLHWALGWYSVIIRSRLLSPPADIDKEI